MGKSKYDHVTANLPRAPIEDPDDEHKDESFEQKVLARQAELAASGYSTAGLARLYRQTKQQQDELNAQLKKLNVEKMALLTLIVNAFEGEGIDMLRVTDDEGFKVSWTREPHVKVEDRDAVRKWAIEEGLERSLQLPWQTLNKLTKERLIAGGTEPPGTKAFFRDKLSVLKG
jgi:hypothetical protein